MTDLYKLLPQKFQDIDAWKDLADVYQEKIFSPNLDSFQRIKDLREVTQADADQLHHIKELLGVPISIESFAEAEKRRLLELITFWYEKSGTKFFIDLLRFVKNADVELFELFTNVDVQGEILASGDGITSAFAGNLTKLPIDNTLGNITITDGTQVLTDDLAGNFTGDGSGTIDYNTGAYSISFTAPPPVGTDNILADYFTHEYQEFVKEGDVTGTFTKDGGNFYLTNHVGILFDLEAFDPANITKLFYQIASTVLVLRVIEGLLKGLNSIPIQIVGEGHVEETSFLKTTIQHKYRNIPYYDRPINLVQQKFNTIGWEPGDEFEPALIPTPGAIIPRHFYVVGQPECDTVVIGGALAGTIDSLSPSVLEANYELPVFDTLEVQEIYRSKSALDLESIQDSLLLSMRTLIIGHPDLDGLEIGDPYWDFVEIGDPRVPYDGTTSNVLVIPFNPGQVVVTDGIETFVDDTFGNLVGNLGGVGYVDYSEGRMIALFNTQPTAPVLATFSGGQTKYTTSYKPVEETFNWKVGQSDFSQLVVGGETLNRLHGGRIDIDYERTEPTATSQHAIDYDYWRDNIVFGGPRLSGTWTYLAYGLDAPAGVTELQVRYSSVSDSGPWSAWEPLTDVNFTARWIQCRLHYERPSDKLATTLNTNARVQLDVRDKREVLLKQLVPATGFTLAFGNTYFIQPSTRFTTSSGVKAVIDSVDNEQLVFHLEDSLGNSIESTATVEVRGY